MKHIVCLTKSYLLEDINYWYDYHHRLGYTIHIIDNDSTVNVKGVYELLKSDGDTYEEIHGWPNQWQLFDDILKKNRYGFKDGDYVAFIDDDEYIWYYQDYYEMVEKYNPKFEGKHYDSLEEYLQRETGARSDHAILMPQILMSTNVLTETRFGAIVNHSVYRRDDEATQGKVFIRYDSNRKYQFNHDLNERGHVPLIDGKRQSFVNASAGVSNTTYGAVDYNACIRLYHYHIKSDWDWTKKFSRGSAAVDHQWYNQAIQKNKNYGGYVVPDFTMYNTWRLLGL